MVETAPYPAHWEADVVAADGGTVHIRPISPDDADRLVALHSRLSPQTIHYRYFSPRPQLSARDVERFTRVDHEHRVALVATLGADLIAVARYDRLPGTDEAEVAFVVEDRHQGRGLGTVLLEHLAAAARERGICRFVAETLPENRRMIGVFRDAGWEVDTRFADGVVHVSFAIDPTPGALAVQAEKERRAEALSMARLLAPRSIAVIGASRTPGTIGHVILANLLGGGFAGPVYPVHRTAAHVGSVRAYASVVDIPDDVDLAVIVVPAAAVLDVVHECAEKRVLGVVVISAGFGELGDDAGVAAQQELVQVARRYGMRVIGPNSMGIVNTRPDVCMQASVATSSPRRGRVSFLSQSGALGIAILDWADEIGIGVSTFVSVGNKADVSGNDLLQYWHTDTETDVVLLYLESFGNPRKFARVARRVSQVKPIVAVKGGRRRRAGPAPTSSLAAAAAGHDVAVEALFHQTGVVRVDTLEQLFDVASVLVGQPRPRGRRVVVVASRGGPGILAADACEGAGLELAELGTATRRALSAAVPGATGLHNPLELAAWATPADYGRVIELVLADDGVDAVMAVYTPVLRGDDEAVAAAAAAAGRVAGKPVVATLSRVRPARDEPRPLPTFRSPEAAAHALARAADYAAWRRRPEGVVPDLDGIDLAAARLLVDTVLTEAPEGTWLSAEDAGQLLSHVGIPVLASTTVTTVDEAVKAAQRLGGRVVLAPAAVPASIDSDTSPSQTVSVGADEVAAAFETCASRSPGGEPFVAVVQPQVDADVRCMIGVVQDPTFGPLVMLGAAGGSLDLLADRVFRVTPITDLDAVELVAGLRAGDHIFDRPGAPVGRAEVRDLLLRVGRLIDEVPEVAEMDLHPVRVGGSDALAIRSRIRLSPWAPRPDLALRRMR